MRTICMKNCPYHYRDESCVDGVDVCTIPKGDIEYHFFRDERDERQHIGLEFNKNGKPLRCEQCINRFGDGLSDIEIFILRIKRMPFRIYYKIRKLKRLTWRCLWT